MRLETSQGRINKALLPIVAALAYMPHTIQTVPDG